jgi:hypothetical protein
MHQFAGRFKPFVDADGLTLLRKPDSSRLSTALLIGQPQCQVFVNGKKDFFPCFGPFCITFCAHKAKTGSTKVYR